MTFAPSYYACPMMGILSNLDVFKNSTNFKTKESAVCFSDTSTNPKNRPQMSIPWGYLT